MDHFFEKIAQQYTFDLNQIVNAFTYQLSQNEAFLDLKNLQLDKKQAKEIYNLIKSASSSTLLETLSIRFNEQHLDENAIIFKGIYELIKKNQSMKNLIVIDFFAKLKPSDTKKFANLLGANKYLKEIVFQNCQRLNFTNFKDFFGPLIQSLHDHKSELKITVIDPTMEASHAEALFKLSFSEYPREIALFEFKKSDDFEFEFSEDHFEPCSSPLNAIESKEVDEIKFFEESTFPIFNPTIETDPFLPLNYSNSPFGFFQSFETWACGNGINRALQIYIGDNVLYTHPEISGFCLFNSVDAQIEFARSLIGDKNNPGLIKDNLTKPVVMILNTNVKIESDEESKRIQSVEGFHWAAAIILPKEYIIDGQKIERDKPGLFFVDSKFNTTIPKSFIKILHSSEKTSDLEVIKNPPFTQQLDSWSCGYWALYNAFKIITTGNNEYLKMHTELSEANGKKLKNIFTEAKACEDEAPLLHSSGELFQTLKNRIDEFDKSLQQNQDNVHQSPYIISEF